MTNHGYEVEIELDRLASPAANDDLNHGIKTVELIERRVRDLTCHAFKVEATAYLLEATVHPHRRPGAPITVYFCNLDDSRAVRLVLGKIRDLALT